MNEEIRKEVIRKISKKTDKKTENLLTRRERYYIMVALCIFIGITAIKAGFLHLCQQRMAGKAAFRFYHLSGMENQQNN